MQYCPNCGEEIDKDSVYCKYCGEGLIKYNPKKSDREEKKEHTKSTEESQKEVIKNRTKNKNKKQESNKNNIYETIRTHSEDKREFNAPYGTELRIFGILSSLGILGGVILPWTEFSATIAGQGIEKEVAGFEHNIGMFVLIIGVITIFLFFTDTPAITALGGLGGLIVSILALLFIGDPLLFENEMHGFEEKVVKEFIEIGDGVYVTLIGGIGALIAGVLVAVTEDK